MLTNYELYYAEKSNTLSLNKRCSVKTALSFHNENKTQFLISIGCKWSFALLCIICMACL